MDKQLACATFATLIPVLLIAGYFSSDFRDAASEDRFGRAILWSVITAAVVGEFAAILGVVWDTSPQWQALVSASAAGVTAGGVFLSQAMFLLAACHDARRQRREAFRETVAQEAKEQVLRGRDEEPADDDDHR